MTKWHTLPYPPSVNHMYGTFNNRRVLSRGGRVYKETVSMLLRSERPVDGEVSIDVKLYRPRKSGDLDNSLKAILDSLKGWLWHDDKQVTRIHAERFDDKVNPRAEVMVLPVAKGAE